MTRYVSRGAESTVGQVESLDRGRSRVAVDGKVYDLAVVPIGPASFAWIREGRVERFFCVRQGPTLHVSWRGWTYRFVERDPAKATTNRSGHASLEAPMPGRVTSVKVAVGGRVTKGQEILVIEAMKMESAIRAPRDGIVSALHVGVGDAVRPGLVLLEVE